MHMAENFYGWLAGIPFLNGKLPKEDTRHLVKLNALLEKDAFLNRVNEALLEERLNELEKSRSIQGEAYGLTLARINELTLLCAGNYADHGEVQGVGDLLFNPRRVLVHIRGMPRPVVKERHMALTEQFADVAATRGAVVAWLRDKTVIEIEQQALLPHLYERLRESRVVSLEYLDSIKDRMRKVADLTGFFASGYFPNGLDFHQWLPYAGTADKRLVESKFCRFDTTIFFELGKNFRQILQLRNPQPGFLGNMDTAPEIG